MPRHRPELRPSRPGPPQRALLSSPGGPSPRPVPAAALIAPGPTHAMPRLTGIPQHHELLESLPLAAALAEMLIRAGIARPQDWVPAKSPIEFLQRIIAHHLHDHGAADIDKVFGFHVQFADAIRPEYDPSRQAAPTRVYLTVDPVHAGYCCLRDTVPLLRTFHPHLPATFYQRFRRALWSCIRVYDYMAAQDYLRRIKECCDGDEEEIDLPDVDHAIPPAMGAPALTPQAFRSLRDALRRSKVEPLLAALDALESAARGLTFPSIPEEDCGPLGEYDQPLPSLLVVFTENDAIEGCFDDEMESESEGSPFPTLILPMLLTAPRTVQIAFRLLARFCDTMAAAARLLLSLPGGSVPHTGGPPS